MKNKSTKKIITSVNGRAVEIIAKSLKHVGANGVSYIHTYAVGVVGDCTASYRNNKAGVRSCLKAMEKWV